MFKKSVYCFLLVVLFYGKASSQEIMRSMGATISMFSGKLKQGDVTAAFSEARSAFTFFPRVLFAKKENTSFSVGAPLAVGVGIANNATGDDPAFVFVYDIPVVCDYNMGYGALRNSDKQFGGYAGVGLGYSKTSISRSNYMDFNGGSFGPIFRGGLRFGSFKANCASQRGLTVGVYYKIGLEAEHLKTLGFNLLIDL